MSGLNDLISRLKGQYVIKRVQNTELPQFEADRLCRYRVKFSGKLQNAGFRLEMLELAKRLELTGFCENRSNGDVYAELQGPENKVHFLISSMGKLRRAKVTHKQVREIPCSQDETEFAKR